MPSTSSPCSQSGARSAVSSAENCACTQPSARASAVNAVHSAMPIAVGSSAASSASTALSASPLTPAYSLMLAPATAVCAPAPMLPQISVSTPPRIRKAVTALWPLPAVSTTSVCKIMPLSMM